MPANSHRIRRQRWQIKASTPEAAFAIRQQLRMHLDTELLPVFERAFDEFGSSENLVHIPRLELELKLQSGEDFIAALSEALRGELGKFMQAAATHPSQSGWQITSLPASRRQALLHYLSTGHVEWHAAAQGQDDLASMLIAEALALAQALPNLYALMSGSLAQRFAIAFRLLQLLPDVACRTLLSSAPLHAGIGNAVESPDDQDAASVLPFLLSRLAMSNAIGGHLLLRARALLLALRMEDLRPSPALEVVVVLCDCLDPVPSHVLPAPLQAVLERYVQSLHADRTPNDTSRTSSKTTDLTPPRHAVQAAAHPPATADRQAAAADDAPLPATIPQARTDAIGNAQASPAGQVQARKRDDPAAPPSFPEQAKQSGIHRPEELSRIRTDTSTAALDTHRQTHSALDTRGLQNEPQQNETARPAMRDAAATAADWLTVNAGLVLLHPFLPRLFKALGLTQGEQQALPPTSQARAAALLHWLACGKEEIYEFELTAIKVLLGLSPEDTLLTSPDLLDESDRAEGDALLAAAISHWSALGQTSMEGLRLSFLQRRGVLRADDAGWQLRIEPESFDLLLGRLPWGISIVRLPWMTRPIFTEWPTP